jgi:hypothetical protein
MKECDESVFGLDLLDPNNAIIGNEFAAIYSEIVGLFAE